MSPVDLTTQLAEVTLPNPVMTAAGCAGSGRELAPYLDLAELGAVVTRTIVREARPGHRPPRLAEAPSGVLSAVGQQGPGIDGFLATDLPWLAQRKVRAIVSIGGWSLGEYAELARRVGNSPGVTAIEVNLLDAARDPYQAAKILAAVSSDIPRGLPVLAKLSPDATSVVDVARAALDSGADAVVLVGGLLGLAIDPKTLRPALGATTGWLSGPAIRPVALRCVWEVHRAVPELPIIGVGGVSTGSDALAMLAAGAVAVQVGTATFRDPAAPARVRDELAEELETRGLASAAEAVGVAHNEEELGT